MSTSKKRIMVTGAGGSPAANFIRSLRKSPEDFHIVGTDASKYYLMRSETDSRYLVPRADDPMFLPVLNEIISQEGVDFIHIQNDTEIGMISEHREKLN